MKSITDWMLENSIANHWKQAENITRLLQLGDLYNAKRFDEIRARAKLYRDHRNSGEEPKVAAVKAISGEPVPAPLFDGVLHSEG